jgi:hypothetical protein
MHCIRIRDHYWSEAVNPAAGSAAGKAEVYRHRPARKHAARGSVAKRESEQAREAIQCTPHRHDRRLRHSIRNSIPPSLFRARSLSDRQTIFISPLRYRLASLPPWSQSDLGSAIVTCSDDLQVDSAGERRNQLWTSGEIIVISDLTTGCDVRALEQVMARRCLLFS